MHLPARRRLALVVAVFAMSLLSCGREVTGPDNGIAFGRRIANLALAPEMPTLMAALDGASTAVPFERVRVVLRNVDGSVAKDTTVTFPAGEDSIALALQLPIPITAPDSGLPLALSMAYVNASGDTVFRGGPNPVVARPAGRPGATTPVTIPIVYDGVGKDAARVAIVPKTASAVAGTTSTFTGKAFDAQDAEIANTPLLYFTLDSARASVASATGVVTWRPSRGLARIVAALPSGARADTAFVNVSLPAAKLVLANSASLTGAVNAVLRDTIVLRTLASDDVPVAGVSVNFAVDSGGGSLAVVNAVSDSLGRVRAVWTLGPALGTQRIRATAAGLTGSPLLVSATAVAGAPVRLDITAQPTSGTAGAALAPAVTVTARDAFGNVATAFTDSVSVTVAGANAPALLGTRTRAAAAGLATFNDLRLERAGTHRLIVASGSLTPDTTTAMVVEAGPAVRLRFAQPPVGAVAGVNFLPPVTVQAFDAFGNATSAFTGSVALGLLASNGATLRGTLTQPAVAGLASFPDLNIREGGTGYRLTASGGSLATDTTAAFSITAAGATQLVVVSGNAQTGTVGSALAQPLVVVARDAFNNPVSGASVAFSVTGGNGTIASAPVLTDALGRASATWQLGPVAGAQQVEASLTAAPTVKVPFTATATAGTPTQVVITSAPTSGVAGAPLSVSAQVRDAQGNLVTTYTGQVRLALGSNPTGATLDGTLDVAAVGGIATFTTANVKKAASGYTMVATATTEGMASAPSAAFTIVAAAAAQLTITGGDNQTGAVNTAFPDSLRVRVTDAFGNPRRGHRTLWSGAGVTTVTKDTVFTDANGVASNAATFGATVGPQPASPSVTAEGIAAPVAFAHTVVAGAATQLAVVQPPAEAVTAGQAFTMVVQARDASGNVATSFTGDVTVNTSGVNAPTLSGTRTRAAVGGVVTFTDLSITTAGSYSLAISAPGLTGVTASGLSITAAAAATLAKASVSNDGQTIVAGATSLPFRVRVTDPFGNPVAGVSVAWAAVGSGTFATPTTSTNPAGEAEATMVAPTSPQTVQATASVAALTGQTMTFTANVTAAPASALRILTSASLTATAGASIGSIAVRAEDAFGNPAAYGDSLRVRIVEGPAGGRLVAGDSVVRATNGSATFASLALDKVGAYTLEVSGGMLTAVRHAAITVSPAAADSLEIVSGNGQSVVAGESAGAPLTVRVRDRFGNVVPGALVAFDVLTPGVVTLTTPEVTADATGLAATGAVAGQGLGAFTVLARTGARPDSVTFSGNVVAGSAADIMPLQGPVNATAGQAMASITYKATDRFGNFAGTYTGFARVTAIPATVSDPSPVIGSGDSVAVVAGIATWNNLVLTSAGNARLIVNFGGGIAVDTTAVFTVTAAAAAQMGVVRGTGASAPVLSTFDTLAVRVTDGYGNVVAGTPVTWSLPTGFVTVAARTTTDAQGRAWLLAKAGAVADTFSVVATSSGLTGSPAAIPVTVTAGAAYRLQAVSAPTSVQAMVVGAPYQIAATDSLGNRVTTFTDSVSVSIISDSPGFVSGTTKVRAAAGVASFTDLVFGTTGSYSLRFASGTLQALVRSVSVTPGTADSIAIAAGDGQAGYTTLPLHRGLAVLVFDAAGNRVPNATVLWTVLPGTTGGTINGQAADTVVTDQFGGAYANYTAGTTIGTQRIRATASNGRSVEFSATIAAMIGNAVWIGAQDGDWTNPENWNAQYVPRTTDSVHITAGRAHYPVLAGDIEVRKLWVEDGVTNFALGIHKVLVTGDIRAPQAAAFTATSGSVQGVGSGSHTISGAFPTVYLDNGSYAVNAPAGQALSVAGDLRISAGATLAVDVGDSVRVDGSVITLTGGRVVQTGNSGIAAGDLWFATAGSTFGAGGRIHLVGGLLVDTAAAFSADSAHTLYLHGGEPTVTISDSTGNRLGSLTVDGGAAATLGATGLTVAGNVAIVGSGSQLSGTGSLVYSGGRLTDAVGDRFTVSSTVLTGTDGLATPAFGGARLLLRGSTTLQEGLLVRGVLRVESGGTLDVNGYTLTADDSLVTAGTGTLRMDSAEDTVVANGAVQFDGGPSQLSNGVLRVQGDVDVSSASGLQAGSTHTTEFFGGRAQTVSFNAPGTSSFGRVRLVKTSGKVTSSTETYVNGQLVSAGTSQTWSGAGWNTRLTVKGADIAGLSLENQPLIVDGGEPVSQLADLRFRQFDGGLTQLSIQRGGGTIALVAPVFDSLASPPDYLAAIETEPGNGDTLTVVVSRPAPAYHAGRVVTTNGARITGWRAAPVFTWSGSADSVWTNPSNWVQNLVPSAEDSVYVGSSGVTPVLATPTAIGALTWRRAQSLNLSANLTITRAYADTSFSFPGVACSTGGRITFAPSGTLATRGWMRCPVHVTSGLVRPVSWFTLDSLIVDGGTYDANGPLTTAEGDIRVTSGALVMDSTADVITVYGTTRFSAPAGATPALTAGMLVLYGDFVQDGAATAFQPSGSHLVQIGNAAANQTVTFANPDSTSAGSYFNDVELGDYGHDVVLNSDVFLRGPLRQSDGRFSVTSSGSARTLHSVGANIWGGNFTNVRWVVDSASGISSLSDVTFIGLENDGTQLRLRDIAGSATISGVTFDSTGLGANDVYLAVDDPNGATSGTFEVTVSTPAPAYHGGRINESGGRILGWDPEPTFVWTGLVDSDWHKPGNWSSGIVPMATSDVVIPDVSPKPYPIVGATASARNLRVDAFGYLEIGAALRVRGSADFFGSAGVVSGGILRMTPDTAVVYLSQSGFFFDVPIEIAQGAATNPVVRLASDFKHDGGLTDMTVRYGTFSPNGHALTLSGDFVTADSGRLQMTDTNDSLDVNRLRFGGGSTQGMLTNGGIFFSRSFVQAGGAPDAFAADAGLRINATMGSADSIYFANPGASGATSRLGSFTGFTVEGEIRLKSRVVVAGSLRVANNAILRVPQNDTLDVYGSVDIDGTVTGTDYQSALRMRTGTAGADLAATGSIRIPLVLASGADGNEGRVRMVAKVNLDTLSTGFNGSRHGLYLRAGVLDVNGNTLHSRGGLRVGGSGILEMNQAADSVNAEWNVLFAGPNSEGYLTNGVLVANSGSFYQSDSVSTKSFTATGSHRTVFSGGNTQIDVDFASSSATTSRFAGVSFAKSQFDVNFYDNGPGPSAGDTVFAQALQGSSSNVYIDGGSLVVLGGVSGLTSGTWYMQGTGIVDLRGVDPATCDGLLFTVAEFKSRFRPSSCHTAWVTQTSGTTQQLNAVKFVGDSTVVAVGNGGVVLRKIGDGPWTALVSNTSANLHAIATNSGAGSTNEFWAVGANGTVVSFAAFGTTGTIIPTGVSATLYGATHATGYLWVSGEGGLIRRWTGSSWVTENSFTTETLFGIEKAPTETIVAFGSGGVIRRYTGTSGNWGVVESPVSTTLRSFVGDFSQLWHVGDQGTIVKRAAWNDTTRTVVSAVPPIAAQLNAVNGLYDQFLFAVGLGGNVLRYERGQWTPVPSGTAADLYGVAVNDRYPLADAYAVGAGGLILKASLGRW